MSNNIQIGLEKRKRQRMVAEGASLEAIAAQDAKIAALQTPINAAKVMQDAAVRSLIGDGFDNLDGPEMSALRQRIRAAEESADPVKPSTASAKIAAGLKARQAKQRDDTHLPNWEAEVSLRRT
jgi:hypothetical protein